jgi:hypothetical protein
MKVYELIEFLKTLDENMNVFIKYTDEKLGEEKYIIDANVVNFVDICFLRKDKIKKKSIINWVSEIPYIFWNKRSIKKAGFEIEQFEKILVF